MKIIQSFSLFEKGNFYASSLNGAEKYLHFYTFLLSFLTLKKYYGQVTMFCNQEAYNTFIRFIPYDEIIIKENKYSSKFWSAYKLDCLEDVDEPFIHVDSDVFLFDDLFTNFINNDSDVLIQYKFDWNNETEERYNERYSDICPYSKYDNKAFTCGVIGFSNIDFKDYYINQTKIIYKRIEDGIITGNNAEIGFYLEELVLYLNTIEKNIKWDAILDYDDINNLGLNNTCEKNNYTHMWFHTKYQKNNIDLFINKIKNSFSDYYYLIETYNTYLENNNIFLKYIK